MLIPALKWVETSRRKGCVGQTCAKELFIVYLKFEFNKAAYIFIY